jgi:hypothetical protein
MRIAYHAIFTGAAAEFTDSDADKLHHRLVHGPLTENFDITIGADPQPSSFSIVIGTTVAGSAPAITPSMVVRPRGVVRAAKSRVAKQYIAQIVRTPTFPAPTMSLNELMLYPWKRIISRRNPRMRPAFFGPQLLIANPTITPVGSAGDGTFAIDVEEGATVTYSWLTDTMKALSSKEQRFAAAYRPRQRYEFTTKLSQAKMRRYLSALAGSASSAPQYLLGLSFEGFTVAAGSSGNVVQVHPGMLAICDWASVGQRVIVVKGDGTFGSSYITSFGGTAITLFDDLSAYAVEGARIMPVVEIYLDPNQPIGQHPKNLTQWDLAAIAVRRSFAGGLVGQGAAITTYDGLPVWTAGVGVSNVAQQPMMSGTELLDLGGSISAIGSYTVPDWGRQVRMASSDPADWQWTKKFFDTVNGGRVAFLLPTGRQDLVHVGDASTGTLVVQGPPTEDAPDYVNDWFPSLAHRRLMIVKADGTVAYREVNSCLDNGDGTQNLVLDSALAGAIDHVQFLEQVRLDGNELRVSWTSWGFATTFTVRVVQR